MGENSTIEWTDHTFNPWIGCTKIADGCANCYAASEVTRYGKAKWGPNGTRVATGLDYWQKPLKWNRDAAAECVQRRVFCASWADVFEDWQGPLLDSKGAVFGGPDYRMHDLRLSLFRLIDSTPNLNWLLLTKRPENIQRFWTADARRRQNVWLGTSVSTQADVEKNIPHLVACRDLASVLFVSAEPLLGFIHIDEWANDLDWAIGGGESGPHARPVNDAWARVLRDQCQRVGIAFHWKQWGEWLPRSQCTADQLLAMDKVPRRTVDNGNRSTWKRFESPCTAYRVGKQQAGRTLDRKIYDEFPRPRFLAAIQQ